MLEERRSAWERLRVRLFGARTGLPERLEKVLSYVAHRLDEGARLEEVIREEYVRRRASPHEIERVIADPGIVAAAREGMHRDFGSGGLDPGRRPRRDPRERPR
jgi:hypothetical protein